MSVSSSAWPRPARYRDPENPNTPARALIGAPELVIADEPTSSLDADRRSAFLDLLFRECARERTTLIFVSHDASLAPQFDREIAFAGVNRALPSSAAAIA